MGFSCLKITLLVINGICFSVIVILVLFFVITSVAMGIEPDGTIYAISIIPLWWFIKILVIIKDNYGGVITYLVMLSVVAIVLAVRLNWLVIVAFIEILLMVAYFIEIHNSRKNQTDVEARGKC